MGSHAQRPFYVDVADGFVDLRISQSLVTTIKLKERELEYLLREELSEMSQKIRFVLRVSSLDIANNILEEYITMQQAIMKIHQYLLSCGLPTVLVPWKAGMGWKNVCMPSWKLAYARETSFESSLAL